MLLFYFGGIDTKVSDTDCKSVSFGTRCFEYIYLHNHYNISANGKEIVEQKTRDKTLSKRKSPCHQALLLDLE
jgi:hypothetical protein